MTNNGSVGNYGEWMEKIAVGGRKRERERERGRREGEREKEKK